MLETSKVGCTDLDAFCTEEIAASPERTSLTPRAKVPLKSVSGILRTIFLVLFVVVLVGFGALWGLEVWPHSFARQNRRTGSGKLFF